MLKIADFRQPKQTNNNNQQLMVNNFRLIFQFAISNILALKFVKFLKPKDTLFNVLILLLQPSIGPFEYGTLSAFLISVIQLKIFDKFYRGDEARQTNNGGTGLGLAITKEIIELHEGIICAKSNDEMIEFQIILKK